jgi:hypothetical protein
VAEAVDDGTVPAMAEAVDDGAGAGVGGEVDGSRWREDGLELTRSRLRHAELSFERHDLNPHLACRQRKRCTVDAFELRRHPHAGPTPL